MRYSSKIKEVLKLKWPEFEAKYSAAIRECEKEAVTKVLGCMVVSIKKLPTTVIKKGTTPGQGVGHTTYIRMVLRKAVKGN